MFGVGGDAGQTTIRLRHAWGQWKQFGAGQTNSQFMDVDVFPNIARLLGTERHALLPECRRCSGSPTVTGDSNARVAIETSGCERRRRRARRPRRAAERRRDGFRRPTSRVTIASRPEVGLRAGRRRAALHRVRRPHPDDRFDLNGHVWGWGISISSNVKVRRRTTCCASSSSTATASRTTSTTRRWTSA